MKKFFNCLLIISLICSTVSITANSVQADFDWRATSNAWRSSVEQDTNLDVDESNTQNINDQSDQEVQSQSVWKKIKGYGKTCGSWIKRNPVLSATTFGSSIALGILGASGKARKLSAKLIKKGFKFAVSTSRGSTSLLNNKYFLYGTGLLSGGAAAYAYRKQIAQSTGRWTQDAIDTFVGMATDSVVGKLQDPVLQAQLDAALNQRGQSLGSGITEGAVARADAIKNSAITWATPYKYYFYSGVAMILGAGSLLASSVFNPSQQNPGYDHCDASNLSDCKLQDYCTASYCTASL